MSIPVPLDELPGQIERYGAHAYLLSVAADGSPRANSVSVRADGGGIEFGAGRRTAQTVEGNDRVALLWPAPAAGGHALIVDGRGTVRRGADGAAAVRIQPASAVLHVTGRWAA